VHEFLIEEKLKPNEAYVQDISNDGMNLRIICFTPDQAGLWKSVRSFQMDMSFKRIAGDIHEVVIASMVESLGTGMNPGYNSLTVGTH
jgi:hypothetical protein